MRPNPLLLALATGATLAGSLAGAAEGRTIQKWTDANGVVHYGDAPPPEAVKTDRTLLNEHGVPVGTIPRQLTPEEYEAAQKQREEEARRRAQDSFLLSTYNRVSDIERARDEQLALVDAQIELAKSSLTASDQRIESLKKRMSGFKPYSDNPNARRLPDALAGEVVQALGERRSVRETLARHEARREELRAKFDADIDRYRELTSRPSIR
jgi:hypothetical protein